MLDNIVQWIQRYTERVAHHLDYVFAQDVSMMEGMK